MTREKHALKVERNVRYSLKFESFNCRGAYNVCLEFLFYHNF
jgi:hypothetical protein